MERRLIAGTINYYEPEDGWENIHMDKSHRMLAPADGSDKPMRPPDVVWDITDLLHSPEEDYDEVRCWQTLEHVAPERAHLALEGFFRILKSGGALDIEVPNLDAIVREWGGKQYPKEDLLRGIYGTVEGDLFPDEHLMVHRNGFWPQKLSKMLRDAGFKSGKQIVQDGPDQKSLQLRYRAVKP